MHLSVCLKSNTSTRPFSVPMQISPFAAMTVGAPTAEAPNIACTLAEVCRAGRCAPRACNCAHLNTSRASEGSCPFACAKSSFSAPPGSGGAEEDEPGESVKLDGTGETPRRGECALVKDVTGDACVIYERKREVDGCRKDGESFEGIEREVARAPFGRKDDIVGGEEREAEVEEGESVCVVEG
jgi:hypothetical protein